jgi:hypothetical protein
MKVNRQRQLAAAWLLAGLAACASPPPAPAPEASPQALPEAPDARAVAPDETTMPALLRYGEALQRMSAAGLARERATLASAAPGPATQIRLALLLGQARGAPDLPRALALLDGVLKAREPAAVGLHPLARLLAANYQERLKLQMQGERLSQQLGESQLRNAELQETIDALAAIERSLPVRPAGGESPPGSPR